MKCVVTGGLGFIGSNLSDRLIELGHEVCILDNLSSGYERRLNPEAKWINIDLTSINEEIYDQISTSLNGDPDVVFHLAVDFTSENMIDITKNNLIGTIQILDLCKNFNSKLIYAGLHQDSRCDNSPYTLTKWFGEEACKMYQKNHDLSVAIARIFNVYGLRQSSEGKDAKVIGIFEKQKIDDLPLTVTGNGSQKRDFIHVYDVAEALIKMADKRWAADVFVIGFGKNISILELAKLFKPISIKYIERPKGEKQEVLSDISTTCEKLNWKPSIDLEEYIDHFVDALPPIFYERKQKLTFWEKWFGWL